ncbi:undecaprenyl-diphosphatase [Tumebacillus sp. BK434]|uniref:YqaA family protein n=1 Tax=Tumebacillus sp. BK434 TaxID=2512169 RepID=UPI0010DDB037|nr:VTT domain-containing protein [Tumebacillus sp. BK434]TCP55972.1 undecaprenyl-diphosphatase [Tumebacillus sp. BK434]
MFHWIMDMLMNYGWIGLLIVSLAEASFLPVAPDLILIPLTGASPDLGFLYGAIAVAGSVFGSMFGHFIGSKAGYPILRKFMSEQRLEKVQRMFQHWGIWAIVVAGLIPLPFKLFTIAAGVFQMKRIPLMIGALIGRGVRFFGLVLLVRQIGVIKIPEGLEMQFLIGLLVLVGLAVLWYYLKSKKGTWLRERLAGLVTFFRKDFLTPLKRGSRRGATFLALGILASLIVATFAGDVVSDFLQKFDDITLQWVQQTLHPTWGFPAKVVDWAFSVPVVILGYLFVSFVLLFHLRKSTKMRLFSGLVIGMLLIQVSFRYFFPTSVETTVDMLLEVTDTLPVLPNLPSGQVMAAIVLYTSLAYIVWQTQKSWWARILGLLVAFSLIIIAPLSPVLIGNYSLSSTMGGLTAGILWMIGCLITRIVYRAVERGKFKITHE